MLKSRIPVVVKKTQLFINNEEIKAEKKKIESKPAVTNELKEKMIRFKPRFLAPAKNTQNSANIEAVKTKEKKIYSKSAVTSNQASCVKKFQTQPVNRNQVKFQQPGSSQIPGERKRHSLAISKQQKVVRKKADSEQGKKAESEENQSCPEKGNSPESKENDANFNEDYRQFILSGRELTPSMLNRGSGVKFSLNRSSSLIHRPFIVSADPYKEALKAIENMKLSNPRPSQVKRRVLSTPMKECHIYRSNFYEEALKGIETLKRRNKQMQRQKKVTFNLQTDSVPLHSTQQQRKELQPPGESEIRLTRISELDECKLKSARKSSLKISTLSVGLANSKDAPISVPMSSNCYSKIFTPNPVSYKLQSLENSGSPELLGEKLEKMITHDIPKKNRVEIMSPVRLKLNFNDVEVTNKKVKSLSCMQNSIISDTNNGILLRDIPTARNVLDHLADEECSIILLRQKLPIVCGSSVRNPMLIILSEADETEDVLASEVSIGKVIKVPVIKVKEDDVKHLIPLGLLQC